MFTDKQKHFSACLRKHVAVVWYIIRNVSFEKVLVLRDFVNIYDTMRCVSVLK